MRRSGCKTSLLSMKLQSLSTDIFSPMEVLYRMCFCSLLAILELTRLGIHLVVKKSHLLLIISPSKVGKVNVNSLAKWFCIFLTARNIGSFTPRVTLDNWFLVFAISVSELMYCTMFWKSCVPLSAAKRHKFEYSLGRYF